LINSLLISVIHLTLVFLDMLFLVVFLKAVYERWHPRLLKPVDVAIKPATDVIRDTAQKIFTRFYGKSYTGRNLLGWIMLALFVIRTLIVVIVNSFGR